MTQERPFALSGPADNGERSALEKIESLLVSGERVSHFAIQRRIFALVNRRSAVAATTGRLIGIERKLLGGFDQQDVRWQDVSQARISAGMFGATLEVDYIGQPDLAIAGGRQRFLVTGLRKDDAQAVYRVCQAKEQEWREKRRIRELEEMRAKSGGVNIGRDVMSGGSGGVASDAGGSTATRLAEAKKMREQDLISDSEYESIKARIVNSI
jgi:hypothetical protein